MKEIWVIGVVVIGFQSFTGWCADAPRQIPQIGHERHQQQRGQRQQDEAESAADHGPPGFVRLLPALPARGRRGQVFAAGQLRLHQLFRANRVT